MMITGTKGHYVATFTANEIYRLLINDFIEKLTGKKELISHSYDSKEVKEYISELALKTSNSKEYEYYACIDLYYTFNKNCSFSFALKPSYDLTSDNIKTLRSLDEYKVEDSPEDVVVNYENKPYAFQFKRYRDRVTTQALYRFLESKLLQHYYSVKQNYLIILQPNEEAINFQVFDDIHNKLVKNNVEVGFIGFTFNHDNKELITVRVLPVLEQYRQSINSYKEMMY